MKYEDSESSQVKPGEGGGLAFVVAGETAEANRLRYAALDHPALGQQDEHWRLEHRRTSLKEGIYGVFSDAPITGQ